MSTNTIILHLDEVLRVLLVVVPPPLPVPVSKEKVDVHYLIKMKVGFGNVSALYVDLNICLSAI